MCRKLLIGLICFGFCLFFILTLLLHNFKFVFLRPTVYKDILERGIISEVLRSTISETINTSWQDKAPVTRDMPESPIPAQNYENIFLDAFPEGWLEQQIGGVIDEFFTWLYSDQQTLTLEISFGEAKQNLRRSMGENLKKSAEEIPPCTADQIKELEKGADDIICLPPGATEEELENFANQFLEEETAEDFFQTLPEEINVIEMIDDSRRKTFEAVPQETIYGQKEFKPTMEYLNDFRDFVHLAFLILYLITGGLVVLLIIIGLMVWKPFFSVLKTIGTTLFVPSVIILVFSIGGQIIARTMKFSQLIFLSSGGPQVPGMSKAIADGISEIINALVSAFTFYKIIETGIILVIAITLLIIGSILKKKKAKQIK